MKYPLLIHSTYVANCDTIDIQITSNYMYTVCAKIVSLIQWIHVKMLS